MTPLALLLLALQPAFLAETNRWRANREASLKAEGGWLSLAGLFWLKEGANPLAMPAGCGPAAEVAFQAGRATFQGRELREDEPAPAGACTVTLIRRAGRAAIRLKDPNAATRRNFRGLLWYPPAEAYRVTARFVSEPSLIPVLNVVGQTEDYQSPGYAAFRIDGRELKLYPVLEAPGARELFYIFRDATSGKETYPAGRFLYSDLPKDGSVVLDFNRAYNPPCAFTEFATCPLPPPRNRLQAPIPAGELAYPSNSSAR